MKKATAKDRKQIGEWIKHWQTKLFLNDWSVDAFYPAENSRSGAVASTDCSTRYFEASIDFFPSLFSEDAETQRKVVLHEMLHVVLADLQSKAERPNDGMFVSRDELKDSIEHTTTRLTNIINSAWPYKK